MSRLDTPLIMGFLADRYGIVAGFYVIGILPAVIAARIGFMRRWAFKQP